MVLTLREVLFTPETQPNVLSDIYKLIDQEISEKSGVSGVALKLAYKTVTSFAPGYYHSTVEDLFPGIVDKLEPYWADFNATNGSGFGDYLAKRGEEVSDDLLSVTDGFAERSGQPTIVKAYRAVRGAAAKHIQAALPQVGDLALKYMT